STFLSFFFVCLRAPPGAILFPYTTLFRSFRVYHIFNNYFLFLLCSLFLQLVFTVFTYFLIFTVMYLKTHNMKKKRSEAGRAYALDRKSTRLNSSHVKISYAVFCLKKKILY